MGWASRPSFIDGRDAHPTGLCKLFNSRSLEVFTIKLCDREPAKKPILDRTSKYTQSTTVERQQQLAAICD
ncbi:hypothetical protein QUA56_28800 [Microcoleus sp. N3A4]